MNKFLYILFFTLISHITFAQDGAIKPNIPSISLSKWEISKHDLVSLEDRDILRKYDIANRFEELKSDAEKKDDPNAIFMLGMAYEYQWGTSWDLSLAEKLLQDAANRGVYRAYIVLADNIAMPGEGWTAKARSIPNFIIDGANKNIPEAHFALATLYRSGLGVKPSPAKFREHLEASAEGNFIPALIDLSKLQVGGNFGEPPNFDKALLNLQKIDALGDERGKLFAAHILINEKKPNKNYSKAIEYLQALKNAKVEVVRVQGELLLARIGAMGHDPNITQIEAVNFTKTHAEQNLPFGAYFYSFLYKNGWGIEKDEAKSIYWSIRAAQLDQEEHLITLTEQVWGRIINQDESLLPIFRQASDEGILVGKFLLGVYLIRKSNSDPIRKEAVINLKFVAENAPTGYLFKSGKFSDYVYASNSKERKLANIAADLLKDYGINCKLIDQKYQCPK